MAAKEVSFNDEARQRMFRGVNVLANAVKATLGPKGRNAIIERSFGAPTITKEGVSVAKEIELTDKRCLVRRRARYDLRPASAHGHLAESPPVAPVFDCSLKPLRDPRSV